MPFIYLGLVFNRNEQRRIFWLKMRVGLFDWRLISSLLFHNEKAIGRAS